MSANINVETMRSYDLTMNLDNSWAFGISTALSITRMEHVRPTKVRSTSPGSCKDAPFRTSGSSRTNGRKVADEIIIDGKAADGTPTRWIFSEIKQNSFHWRGEKLVDKTWRIYEELSARRKK